MAANDVVGVRVIGRYQAQNIVSTLHYKISAQTVDDHAILQLLATAWASDFTSAWIALHIDTYELVGVKTFSLTGNNKRPGMASIDSAGTVVGIETPSPVCRCITLYTDSDNHWRRGRVMLSGCDTTMFNEDDGAVTTSHLISMATLGDMLIDPVVSDEETFTPVLPAATGKYGALPVEPITAMLCRKTPACIRSRRVRGFSIG